MTDQTGASDVPVTQPAPATTDPNQEANVAGVQLERQGRRAGAHAMGVEFGNPYDPDTPPYSVYNDPQRVAFEQREAEAEAERQLRSKARGTEYRFDGHQSPYEWTEVLKTANGTAQIGETVVLSKSDAEALQTSGFVLTKVEKASKADK